MPSQPGLARAGGVRDWVCPAWRRPRRALTLLRGAQRGGKGQSRGNSAGRGEAPGSLARAALAQRGCPAAAAAGAQSPLRTHAPSRLRAAPPRARSFGRRRPAAAAARRSRRGSGRGRRRPGLRGPGPGRRSGRGRAPPAAAVPAAGRAPGPALARRLKPCHRLPTREGSGPHFGRR